MIIKSFETQRLLLKPISKAFVQSYYVDWMNDQQVTRFLVSEGGYTLSKLRSYIDEVVDKNILMWAIVIKESGIHIGNIKIDPIREKEKSAEYGIMIGNKSFWGLGYAKEASVKIIDHCFKQLKLKKITLGVEYDNVGAIKLYNSLGFIEDIGQSDQTLRMIKENRV